MHIGSYGAHQEASKLGRREYSAIPTPRPPPQGISARLAGFDGG